MTGQAITRQRHWQTEFEFYLKMNSNNSWLLWITSDISISPQTGLRREDNVFVHALDNILHITSYSEN